MSLRARALFPISVIACALTLVAVETAAFAAAPGKVHPTTATDPAPAEGAPAPAAAAPADPKGDADGDKEDRHAIYVSAELGFTRPDLGGIKDNLGFDKTAGNGLLAGLGLGYRFTKFRLGARLRTESPSQFSIWSLMGELGYGLHFRPISPIIFLRAGYQFSTQVDRSTIQSSLPKTNQLTPNVSVEGLVIGAELGASYWFTKFLRAGPFVGLDLTFLHRAQVDLPQSLLPLDDATKNNKLFGDSGSGIGYTINLGLRGTGDISF